MSVGRAISSMLDAHNFYLISFKHRFMDLFNTINKLPKIIKISLRNDRHARHTDSSGAM